MNLNYKISDDIEGKSILVTGGTGSLGNAIARIITGNYSPRRLIVFSRDEMKQYEMAQRFPEERYPFMRYFIGDVRDVERLEMAMYDVDVVIHAAALKHVPAAEYNPFECVHTNIIGAENIVRAALRTNVGKVIALSTDKAANPINLYGASKLASDKIFVAANHLAGGRDVQFSVVRYGNVIGSRGSVIPHFQRLIRDGAKALPITDPRMTRYWMTIDQGVEFILSCLAMMRGGEIFVPKIPSMKIVDLACALAPDMSYEIVGIRPGEKLHEVLIGEDDARNTLELEDRYVIEPPLREWSAESYFANGAKRVPDGFHYTSNNNEQWLDAQGLADLLGDT